MFIFSFLCYWGLFFTLSKTNKSQTELFDLQLVPYRLLLLLNRVEMEIMAIKR